VQATGRNTSFTPLRAVAAVPAPGAALAVRRIYARGGNAVDAAVAATLALCVCDPCNVTIAGRCQVLLAPPGREPVLLDGASMVPQRVEPRQRPVPVPGLPLALDALLRRFGRLSPAAVVAPALELAEEGFQVPPGLARIWTHVQGKLRDDEAARRFFLDPRGAPPIAAPFRQPQLAELLARLAADGLDAFCEGAVAERLAAAARALGIGWDRTSLAAARPRWTRPIGARVFGRTIFAPGREGWGHSLIGLLRLFARAQPRPRFDATTASRLADAVLRAMRLREELAPVTREPPPELLEKLAHPASIEAMAVRAGISPGARSHVERSDTAHLSIVDDEGWSVALTASAGPRFGACVAHPHFGFLFAHSYRMAAGSAPGARDWTEMTPTLAIGPAGARIAIGAAGSARIPQAVAWVLWHLLARDLALRAALRAPRLLFVEDALHVPARISGTLARRLLKPGIPLRRVAGDALDHLGIVQIALCSREGHLRAAADPAFDGRVVRVQRRGRASTTPASNRASISASP